MTGSTGANLPGQLACLCGHDIQVAWCGIHSAGMQNPRAAGVDDSVGFAMLGMHFAFDLCSEPNRNLAHSFREVARH
jgi:hypothetical protein